MFALDRLKLEQTFEKSIRSLIFLLPVIFLFGIHVVFCMIPNFGYLTLPRIYEYLVGVLTIAYFIAKRRVSVNLGRAIWYAAVLVVMMAYAFITLIWVSDRANSLEVYTYQITGVAAACYLAAVIRDEKDLRTFMRILTVCCAVVAVIGVFEIYTGVYLFSPSYNAYIYKDSFGLNFPYSVFYNTNDHASFLAVFSPFAVFTLMDWVKGLKGRILGFAYATLVFFNLLCGRARNSLITMICFLAVLFALCLAIKEIRRYARTVAAVFCGLPVAYLIIRLTAFTNATLLGKIVSVNLKDHSVGQRLEMTLGGLRMSLAYNLMGVGVGNSVPLMPYYSSLGATNLHDMPLQIFVEYGIIIFVLYLAMTVLVARDFLKHREPSAKARIYCLIGFLSVLAFQIEGLQSSDAMHIYAIWLIFGVWFASVKVLYKNDAKIKDVLPNIFNRKMPFNKISEE